MDREPEPLRIYRPQFNRPAERGIPSLTLLDADGQLYPEAICPDINRALAQKIYRTMVYTRLLDERMISAQRQGRLSFYLSCKGEEAAVTGAVAAIDDGDMIMAQYREQAAIAYRGFSTEQFMNQLFSNCDDLGKGRQMPVHYGSRELNFMTISSTLATQIPQAAGFAYGQKLAGQDQSTLCFFGEGAASEGDFHAGLNMAAVLSCPVIFFCRNNGYAISTPASEQFKGDGVASRGLGYGIPSLRVDGNDILAVYSATLAARELAIRDQQPVLIEAMSYRLGAHSTSDDPSGYRSKDEEEKWRLKDPIERMKLWLQHQGWWQDKAEADFVEQQRQDILRTLKQVEQKPAPDFTHIFSDVYDQPLAAQRQQAEQLAKHIRKYPERYPATADQLPSDASLPCGGQDSWRS